MSRKFLHPDVDLDPVGYVPISLALLDMIPDPYLYCKITGNTAVNQDPDPRRIVPEPRIRSTVAKYLVYGTVYFCVTVFGSTVPS